MNSACIWTAAGIPSPPNRALSTRTIPLKAWTAPSRTSDRCDFVGGIRGLGELERRCAEGMALAFSLYPVTMDDLFRVADAGEIMPPKSTWFEPKLRSGLFVHTIEH